MRKSMTYTCPECGYEKTYDIEDIEGNGLVKDMWDGEEYHWPPFVICGECLDDNKTVRMWPALKGPTNELHCSTAGCDFSAEMPDLFPRGWKCPKCRYGNMI